MSKVFKCLFFLFGFLGVVMDSAASDGKCFVFERERLCISEGLNSGSLFKDGGYSRVRVLVGDSDLIEGAVVYIERYGNSLDDPGRTVFENAAANTPERLMELDNKEDYIIYKLLAPGRDNDYLLFSKARSEYFILSCVFERVCSIRGTYRGLLSVRLDFEFRAGKSSSLIEMFGEFEKIKDKLIMEEK